MMSFTSKFKMIFLLAPLMVVACDKSSNSSNNNNNGVVYQQNMGECTPDYLNQRAQIVDIANSIFDSGSNATYDISRDARLYKNQDRRKLVRVQAQMQQFITQYEGISCVMPVNNYDCSINNDGRYNDDTRRDGRDDGRNDDVYSCDSAGHGPRNNRFGGRKTLTNENLKRALISLNRNLRGAFNNIR